MPDINRENIIFETYKALMPFLVESHGLDAGSSLYKLDEDQSSGTVIAVCGSVGGRAVGDRMPPFINKVLQTLVAEDLPYSSHVDTDPSTVHGRVRLNFFPVRLDNKIIGLMVILVHIDLVCEINDVIRKYLGYDSESGYNHSIVNAMQDTVSLTQYMQKVIEETIANYGIALEDMTTDDKKAIVKDLARNEVFFVKDASRIAANQLNISVPTLYRLLKQ